MNKEKIIEKRQRPSSYATIPCLAASDDAFQASADIAFARGYFEISVYNSVEICQHIGLNKLEIIESDQLT